MSANEFSLIRTKLAPPRIGSAPISREVLLAQLDARRDRTLSLVVGPAGCGKTMLLTQWRKQLFLQGAAVAWYNAGSDDDDLHFAAYTLEALRQSGVEIENESLHVYMRSGAKAWRALLADLVNDIADHASEVYLIVDDFQNISSYAVLQLLDRWLAVAPSNFHLVLGSRTRPPFDLSQLRAHDQITELGFSELRFRLDETRRFIEAQGLTQVSSPQITLLHESTDGWAAGLQLLAFSLRKQKQPAVFLEQLARLSLTQEDALDTYLEKAAIEHLSEAEFVFLIRVSACRRFNHELCALLTGDPRARDYLAKLEADNLFLLPIDTTDAEPWYRFHRLFAAFLNRHLSRLDPAEVNKLHQLASHWFAGKNLFVEALRHATLAHDVDFMVELIDRAARRLVNSAHFIELLKWCASVPRERLRTRLNTCLCLAWAQLSCSRLDDFARTIPDIMEHPAHVRPEVQTEVQLLKAYCCMRQDDTTAQLRIVEPMLLQAPPANPFHHLLLCNLVGLGLLYANRFETARETVRRRYRPDRSGHADLPTPFLQMIHGSSYLMEGRVRMAVESLKPIVEAARSTSMLGADATGLIVSYLIEACYQLDELDTARQYLDQHAELIDAVGAADGLLYAYRVRANIHRIEGDAPNALRSLQRLEELGYRGDVDRLVAWSLYEQISLGLQTQQRADVRELLLRLEQLAQRYRQYQDCAWGEIPLAHSLAAAEVAHAQAADNVLQLLEAAQDACRVRGRRLLMTRIGFLRATTLLNLGEQESARQLGAELIAAALDLGMKRVLKDLGSQAHPLIDQLLATQIAAEARAYLLDARAQGPDTGDKNARDLSASAANIRPDLLSARELEIVELLSKALSTKSIARALDLSAGTVKWHLKNVYGKLNALSREDALAKARARGLIS